MSIYFHFLLRNVFETYLTITLITLSLLHTLTYLFLFNSFLLLSKFSVFLKSFKNSFFRWLACKSLLSTFSMLVSGIMWSSNFFLHPAVFNVFHGPGFSGSRFFRVQVFQGPDFSGSRFFWLWVFQGLGFSGSKFFRVQVFLALGPGSTSRF